MRFLLDMGISNIVDAWLISIGYDSTHIRDNGLHRLEDILIIDKALKEERIILTSDMDFGQLFADTKTDKISLIQFRITDFTSVNIIDKLQLIFDKFSDHLTTGHIITVEDDRIRLRKLPI